MRVCGSEPVVAERQKDTHTHMFLDQLVSAVDDNKKYTHVDRFITDGVSVLVPTKKQRQNALQHK